VIYTSRAQWGARPPKSIKTIASSEGIFVHYTVTPTGPDEASIVRGVQNFHMDTRNWQDIAYSWLVGQSGTIYEGRGWGVAGGHTEGWNSRSHAVCWIGNEEQPTDAALAAINEVCAEHARRYGGWVKAHRDVNQTSCPGDKLAAWLAAGRPLTGEPPEPPTPIEEPDVYAYSIAGHEARGQLWLLYGPKDQTPIYKKYLRSADEVAIALTLYGAKDIGNQGALIDFIPGDNPGDPTTLNADDLAAKVAELLPGADEVAQATAAELVRRLAS
jgi:hypothetical protein